MFQHVQYDSRVSRYTFGKIAPNIEMCLNNAIYIDYCIKGTIILQNILYVPQPF